MKKINRSLIKGTNWVLAGLLSLIGFSSCQDESKEEPLMYGVPWAGYSVKGKVTDMETGKPIPGIEVKTTSAGHSSDNFLRDTTDSKGNYELKNIFGLEEKLTLSDIDGELNGSYPNDTVEINQQKIEHIVDKNNDAAWFNGYLTSQTDIQLEKETK